MEENKRKVEDKLEDLLMEQMNLKRDNAKLTKELQDKTSVLEEYERPGGLKEEILKLRATSTIPGAEQRLDELQQAKNEVLAGHKRIENLEKKIETLMVHNKELNAELSIEMRKGLVQKQQINNAPVNASAGTEMLQLQEEFSVVHERLKEEQANNVRLRNQVEKLGRKSSAELEVEKLQKQVKALTTERIKLLSKLGETDTQCWEMEKELANVSSTGGTLRKSKTRTVTRRDLPALPGDDLYLKSRVTTKTLPSEEPQASGASRRSLFGKQNDAKRKLMGL